MMRTRAKLQFAADDRARRGNVQNLKNQQFINRSYLPRAGKELHYGLRKSITGYEVRRKEKEVEKFWKDNDIFRKSIDNRRKGEVYTFYDGPPTANGKPHIGHC